MSGFLKDDCEIEAVLGELEAGTSEADNTIVDGNLDEGSEVEDNVEVEDDYSEADDTDADPDYYPSDTEETRHTSSFVRQMDIHLDGSGEENATTVAGGPDVSSISSVSQPNSEVIDPENDVSSHAVSVNNNLNLTIMNMVTDENDDTDLAYKPSSGESSSDDCSDMEVEGEEVTNLIREQCAAVVHSKNTYLSSLVQHKNIVLPKRRVLRGKDGHVWSSKPPKRSGRTLSKNIIHYQQKPLNNAKNKINPLECFNLFISSEMIDRIVTHTNEEIPHNAENYAKNSATIKPTNKTEMNALIGLLVLAAAKKETI